MEVVGIANFILVSNQLISLTSREDITEAQMNKILSVSNQLISLTSRETEEPQTTNNMFASGVSNQLISLTSREGSWNIS